MLTNWADACMGYTVLLLFVYAQSEREDETKSSSPKNTDRSKAIVLLQFSLLLVI